MTDGVNERTMRRALVAILAMAVVATSLPATVWAQGSESRKRDTSATTRPDWRNDWETEPGFALDIDTQGYRFPSAIAFVPEPGPGPKDPLYFVTELRGTVKVVTNDRSIHEFARDFFHLVPREEVPAIEGGVGLAGICLDPKNGYVFVTFAEQDSAGVLRNAIVRFRSTPKTFSLQPTEQVDFRHVFATAQSALSHQIGACQVLGDHLYVSVADALQAERSQDTTSVLGKILRMTVDGEPVPSNPFYRGTRDAARGAADYVWAYGLRNPFGLKIVDGTVYIADNGDNIDRFIRARAGENYLWDGVDLGIGARADVVISPSVGPAQLEYAPRTLPSNALPEAQRGNFFIALSQPLRAGIMRIPYAIDSGRAPARPRYMLRYRGDDFQFLTGVALGPDGLYVIPMMPVAGDTSAVIRLRYAPDEAAEGRARLTNPVTLIGQSGCLGCHSIRDQQGGAVGPFLGPDSLRARLEERLGSEAYRREVAQLNQQSEQPMASWRDERAAVLDASGTQQQLLWTTYKILEPRFDNAASSMRDMGLSYDEAHAIAQYLLDVDAQGRPVGPGFIERGLRRVRSWFPETLSLRHLALFAVLGFVAGCAAMVAGGWLRRRWRAP